MRTALTDRRPQENDGERAVRAALAMEIAELRPSRVAWRKAVGAGHGRRLQRRAEQDKNAAPTRMKG
jgi:hypothetical protein